MPYDHERHIYHEVNAAVCEMKGLLMIMHGVSV